MKTREQIDTLPGPYQATVLADSIADDVRLTTMVCTFPRIVLAEMNTHRMMSRNSASSRAIPIKKKIKMVREDPYIPLKFGRNQKGMQSFSELDDKAILESKEVWMEACNSALEYAEKLNKIGLHKQFANRILEPFSWQTAIITATEWDNFWALRISEDAQPEINEVAKNMKAAYDASEPTKLFPGEWHTPLIFEEDINEYTTQDGVDEESLAKISCARAARVSYLTHSGTRDTSKDLELYERLTSSGHMSPLEHAAVVGNHYKFDNQTCVIYKNGDLEWSWSPDSRKKFLGNFQAPWIQYRKLIPNEDIFRGKE